MRSQVPRRSSSGWTSAGHDTPTIVVVDPKPDDYRALHVRAETDGVCLRFVATADEALRLSRRMAVDLWVVNTDLPGLSGYEISTMLKSRSPDTAVLLVADDVSSESERLAWQARATMFAHKPAHWACLDAWLEERRRSKHRRSHRSTRISVEARTT